MTSFTLITPFLFRSAVLLKKQYPPLVVRTEMVVDGPEVLYGGNVYQIALAFLPAHVLLKQQTEIIVTLIPLTGKIFLKNSAADWSLFVVGSALRLFTLRQCFGSGSARIRIKICLLDPDLDPGGKNA